MSKFDSTADEALHALADNQLSGRERSEVLRRAEESASISDRICEIRNLKELVRNAYDEDHQAPPQLWRSPTANRQNRMVVLGLVLFVAVGAVSVMNSHTHDPLPIENVAVEPSFFHMDEINDIASLYPAGAPAPRIVIHVTTNDTDRLSRALDSVESLVFSQQASSTKPQIEIVANGEGLNFLRTSSTAFESRVRSLAGNEYLTFFACKKAVRQLREKGVDVDLMQDINVANTALDRIIQRLQDGWIYVKA